MEILKHLRDLLHSYESTTKLTENGVVLVGVVPTPPPLAKHYIFPPMSNDIADELRASYTRTFPTELLTLYASANGFDLFWKEIQLGVGRRFPLNCLSLYGYPTSHSRTQLQPLNIQLEDGSRLPGTPETYLKFGLYREIENLECKAEYDLFVDTEAHTVCSCNRAAKEFSPAEHWSSVDHCLCNLFDRLYTV